MITQTTMKPINTETNRKLLYSALKRTTYMSAEYKNVIKQMKYLLDNKNN